MTTAFLGTSAFAAAILERLAAGDHRPALVVTRPDRPAGRGRVLTPPPVAAVARELGLAVRQPDSVNTDEVRDAIADSGADVVVVCARLLVRALDERPPFVEQPEEGATYAEKITAADRTLDPDAPADVNERIVRALHPHIGARLPLPDGTFLGVRRARVAEDGTLELLEVQPPGGRPMPYADYVRGHR